MSELSVSNSDMVYKHAFKMMNNCFMLGDEFITFMVIELLLLQGDIVFIAQRQ